MSQVSLGTTAFGSGVCLCVTVLVLSTSPTTIILPVSKSPCREAQEQLVWLDRAGPSVALDMGLLVEDMKCQLFVTALNVAHPLPRHCFVCSIQHINSGSHCLLLPLPSALPFAHKATHNTDKCPPPTGSKCGDTCFFSLPPCELLVCPFVNTIHYVSTSHKLRNGAGAAESRERGLICLMYGGLPQGTFSFLHILAVRDLRRSSALCSSQNYHMPRLHLW